MRKINRIIVHGAWTRASADIGAAEIESWHRDRGFNGIGYHGVIRRDGMYEPGRSEARTGAHAPPMNRGSLGVCLVGGRDAGDGWEDNYRPEQFMTLKAVINWWTALYSIELDCVIGHRDVAGGSNPHCPGFDVRAWVAAGMPT